MWFVVNFIWFVRKSPLTKTNLDQAANSKSFFLHFGHQARIIIVVVLDDDISHIFPNLFLFLIFLLLRRVLLFLIVILIVNDGFSLSSLTC